MLYYVLILLGSGSVWNRYEVEFKSFDEAVDYFSSQVESNENALVALASEDGHIVISNNDMYFENYVFEPNNPMVIA